MRVCAERTINVLRELRFVNSEIHDMDYAERMPREVRHWWIDQMQKDRQEQKDEVDRMRGKRTQSA